MLIEINDPAKYGAISDTPGYMIPPEAWTTGLNVYVVDEGLETMLGWTTTFDAPSAVAPHFAMPVRSASQTFWLYMSLTKGYVWDGTSDTDITRAVGGNYTTVSTQAINGTTLGGIPILNTGNDPPQYWTALSTGSKLADLTAWTANMKARVVRAFGPYLMLFNVTKAGPVNYPHMVKWSSEADPGTLPATWDETDATQDAGEFELSDANSGIILEALPLNEVMMVYKENSTWKLRFVGGQEIFSPGQSAWLQTGILCTRAAAIVNGQKHVVCTQDDIIWHDGNTVRSVLTQKQRRRLFNEIDTTNYATSFMFDDPTTRHVFFCYPTSGASQPNVALVMYYGGGDDNWPVFEMDGITFRNATMGPIESAVDDAWPDDELQWEDDEVPWSSLVRRRLVACGTDSTSFFLLNNGTSRNGTTFTSTIQRVGISVTGKKRDGSWIVDWDQRKQFDAVWPKLQGLALSMRLGAQERLDGGVTWTSSVTFTPGTDQVAYPGPISGRAGAIEFSSTSHFRLDGYKIDVIPLGNF